MASNALPTPYVYFGGKAKIAPQVWLRLGIVDRYFEPFFGGGAMLLARPEPIAGVETVNDLDCHICNFWRAVTADPQAVAQHAYWPVNENDLHARHIALLNQRPALRLRIEGDPGYYDAKLAGWWAWGMANWLGSGFCSGIGPWQTDGENLVNTGGVGPGVWRVKPHLTGRQGILRYRTYEELLCYFAALQDRLRHVRVLCGDWSRVLSPALLRGSGNIGVFLDPPYAVEGRDTDLYAEEMSTATAVKDWALAHGDDSQYRIALCGYAGEHEMPETWEELAWSTSGGYAGQSADGSQSRGNKKRERIWFSPNCLKVGR